jgi:RNA polymerase sigma-70 factor, ECF subfamily
MQVASTNTEQRARFDKIFEAEFGYVWTSLRRLGVSPGDVEDVCHELFLAVYGRMDAQDPTRPVRPWLFAFCVRFASDYRRLARHRVETMTEAPEQDDGRPGADTLIERKEAQDLVQRAIDTLETDRRAVFILHELDQVPIPQVATALEIPLNTAYSRLRLAREDFRVAVKQLQLTKGAMA